MKRRELLLCMCSGIFLGLHFSAYFESLQHTSIAVAAVLVNTEAIFVTLGSVAFLKSRLQGKAWAAVLITFAGSVIVALADLSGGGSLKGNLLALVVPPIRWWGRCVAGAVSPPPCIPISSTWPRR